MTISVDSSYSHKIFAEREGYEFPLLSDFWPHGAVAQAYGVFNDDAGIANRGTFLVDKDGIVRFAEMNETGRRDATRRRGATRSGPSEPVAALRLGGHGRSGRPAGRPATRSAEAACATSARRRCSVRCVATGCLQRRLQVVRRCPARPQLGAGHDDRRGQREQREQVPLET